MLMVSWPSKERLEQEGKKKPRDEGMVYQLSVDLACR